MSKIYKLPLIMSPQPEGGYVVTCPLLPELITEGDTANEAVINANDALEVIIEAYKKLGKPIPVTLFPEQADTPLWLETILTVP